jgi:hypothetical protein
VNFDTFQHQEMVIDYVRTYRRCTSSDSKDSCKHFHLKGDVGVNGYNSSKGETATASINVFPNPMPKSLMETGLSFRLDQDCQQVKIDCVNSLGQEVSESIFNGSLAKDELLSKNFSIPFATSGMYYVRSVFSQCGSDLTGKGNQVFKLSVMDDRQYKEHLKKQKRELEKNSTNQKIIKENLK